MSLKNQYAVVAAFDNTWKFIQLVIPVQASLAISEPYHTAVAIFHATLLLTMLHRYQNAVHRVPSHV